MHSPLDLPTVQALGEYSTHPSLQASANAWLAAYDVAHQLAFTEAVALRQACAAWDRAAETWRRSVGDEAGHDPIQSGRHFIEFGREEVRGARPDG
jgi:hypothetical protein